MKNTRRCKVCRERFEPKWSNQVVCIKEDCVLEFHKLNREKNFNSLKKAERKEMTEKKHDLQYFKTELQKKINAIARHLDFGKGCISCGKPPLGMVYGGHRLTVGSYGFIRYNLHNVSCQCYSCNMKKSGNPDGYNKGLSERYGKEYMMYVTEQMPRDYLEIKYTHEELKQAYQIAARIESSLKRDLKLYEPIEVLELKDKFNNEIGIYLNQFTQC